ncbi:VOC family protein [Paenibacillus thalictri]|uniref:VOC family protein n=1 Tax=Paenibacillus thalictri TaxID=2527873 RepID=A0A4Q9DH71_9BACL|nr:VOC family protein [Paenibacillus thalictri]TBL70050.1 VOC family protein [Paenibacillus thalictri]
MNDEQLIHPDIRLGEVRLKVSDLDRSLQFYQDVIGLSVLKREGQAAGLTADGKHVLIELEEVTDAFIVPRRSFAGLYHFAILLPERKDLGLSLRHLIETGIHIGASDHLVSEALYITDPDHNGIEIYCDRPRASWPFNADGSVKMATDPLDGDGLQSEAEGLEWNGLPAGTTIGHVHFHVSDIQQAKRFYCTVLGFQVMADLVGSMGALFISAGGYHHHIGLNMWAGRGAPVPPANATGLAYFAVLFPDAGALNETVQRLQRAGVTVDREGDVYTAKDPSGITLKLKH